MRTSCPVGACLALLGLVLCAPATAAEKAVRPVNKAFTVVDCGTPIQVLRLYDSTLYKHPETGKLHLLLEYGNNNGYRIGEQEWEDVAHRLIDVELESGAMRRTKGSDATGAVHFLHPNGMIYLFESKTHPASLGEYDPRTAKYRRIGALGDSSYKIVLAPSNRIYVGEVNGGVTVYEPATRTLTHYDMPAGRPIHYGVYTMEVEEPWIYCGMTNQGKWFLTVIDTRTGEAKSYFDVESGQPAAKAAAQSVARTEAGNIFFGAYLLKDGKPLMDDQGNPAKVDPPDRSKHLAGNRPWPNMWRVSGYAGSTSSEPGEALGLEFDVANAEPNNWNGGVAIVRWRKKGEEKWRTIEIKGLELVGTSPKCLAAAPDGKLMGVAESYGSVFRFDPATGKSENVGIAPGSVYEILPLKDATYFCGYVSFLAEYDHNRPYTMEARQVDFAQDTNPKRYRTVAKWTTCMLAGPDGRIYLGGQDGRHTTGGGLSIFDPRTKQMTNIREPFVYLGVAGLALVDGGKTLVVSTRPVGRDIPVKKGSIFLYDIEKQQIAREVKLDDIPANPDRLFVAGDNTLIGVSRFSEADEFGRPKNFTLVYGLDLASGKALFQKRYPGRAFAGMCAYDHTEVVRGPDGCGWLFVDDALCRIHADGELERVREKMDQRGQMVWQGDTLYIYNGGRVYSRLFSNVVRVPDLFAKP